MSATTGAPATLARELPPWRRWVGLVVLSLSLLAVVMDMTVLNVALPGIAADLRPSATQQLWIVDVYSLVLAGLLISASALADRWGRKRMLLAGFALFGAASALVLVAGSAEAVIAVRALLGLGGAMIMPTTLSMVRTVFTDPRERATALGVWAAIAAVGAAVGPIVGGLLLVHFPWQAAFLVNVPLMVIGLVFGAWLLPESRHPRPGRWDLFATVASIAGMAALVWAIKDFAKHYVDDGFANPAAWTALAVSVLALTAFTVRCLRRPDPLLDVRLFTNRGLTAGAVNALTLMFATAALLLLLAQWSQLVEGHSALRTGVYLLPMAAGAAVTSPLAPALAARIGARAVLGGGLVLAAAGFLLLPLAPQPVEYGWIAAALVLLGAGSGSLAVASVLIMSGSPDEKAGSAAAIEETAYDIGNVLGVAVLGSVAAVVYRDRLALGDLPGTDAAKESLGGALEIAAATGSAELAARAQDAFTAALVDAGTAGGIVMLVVAAAVTFLAPRETPNR